MQRACGSSIGSAVNWPANSPSRFATILRSEACWRATTMIRGLLMVALLFPTLALAQLCGLEPAPVLKFSPQSPTAQEPVVIIVGTLTLIPSFGVTTVIDGNTINVTAAGTLKPGAAYPPICVDTIVGPLSPGTYTVNFFSELRDGSNPPIVTLERTASLAIRDASEPIPASTPLSLLALVALVAVAGSCALRARVR